MRTTKSPSSLLDTLRPVAISSGTLSKCISALEKVRRRLGSRSHSETQKMIGVSELKVRSVLRHQSAFSQPVNQPTSNNHQMSHHPTNSLVKHKTTDQSPTNPTTIHCPRRKQEGNQQTNQQATRQPTSYKLDNSHLPIYSLTQPTYHPLVYPTN